MAQVSIDNVTVIPQIAVNSPTKQSTLSFPFVFLPPFVKQHVPKVVSACRLATIGRSDSLDDTPRAWTSGAYHNDSNFNGAITPPPSYAEVVPSQGVDEVTQLQQDARLASNVASLQPAQVTNLKRSGSGIKRKYSRQGLNLLALSAQECASRSVSASSTSSNASTTAATPFSRQLYVHALMYLLRGLPDTLTHDEVVCLRSALPASLDGPNSGEGTGTGSGSRRTSSGSYFDSVPAAKTSRLHQIISATTLKIFMIIALLVPYVQMAIAWTYKFEREHHVSERMFSGSVKTADVLGKQACATIAAVWGLNEGKVGSMARDAALWIVRSVGGGLYQGVGQGMEMLATRPVPERRQTS